MIRFSCLRCTTKKLEILLPAEHQFRETSRRANFIRWLRHVVSLLLWLIRRYLEAKALASEVMEIQDPTKVVISKLPFVQHIYGFPARASLACLLPIQSSLGSGRSTRGVFERPRLSLLKRKLTDSLNGEIVCVFPAASLPRDSDDGFSSLVQATICGAGRARFGISCTDARDSVVETQLDTSDVNPATLAFIDLTVPASHSTSALLDIAVRYLLEMVQNIHRTSAVPEGRSYAKVVTVQTTQTNRQDVPSKTPRPSRQSNRKKQPCANCQRANCRDDNRCRNCDRALSLSVNPSDRLVLEAER